MPHLETYVFWVLLAAALLGAVASLWLLVQAFRAGVGWGLAVLLLPPSALVFIPMRWGFARGPMALYLLAGLLAAGGLVTAQVIQPSRDPRVKLVEGEKHLTLARVQGDEAALLRLHPDVVVVQMAESDVTDETLEALSSLAQLRELDLNHTGITDAGLAHLAKLPRLEVLRLNFTPVTDEGFTTHLADLPALREVNVRQTKVSPAVMRAWVKAGKGLGIERKFTSGK